MNATNRDQAERLIRDFLNEHEKPTAEDWKRLVDRYPEHASAFVDAALIRATGDAASASTAEYIFDAALANKTVSKALNRAHQIPSPNLEAAGKKVAAIRGPTARKRVAEAVGIGPYASLLNGVLVGRTKAPPKVLNALAMQLEIPAIALRELFARLFAQGAAPVFKATGVKPQVAAEPASWDEAVRGLELPPEETERLLKLGDEN